MSKLSRAQEIAKQINKELGPEAVVLGNDPRFVVNYIPTTVVPIDLLLSGGIPRGRWVECYGDWCVAPDSLVLTEDLRWIQAGDLSSSESLIGFTERTGYGRGQAATMMPSTIEHTDNKFLQCVRVITDKGEIVVSLNHFFLARGRKGGTREWRKARNLWVGDSLVWTCEPWQTLNTRSAGYAAGILDGEGWIDWHRLSFGQLPGLVLEEGIACLKRFGFDVVTRVKHNGVIQVCVTGGRYETLRALGQLRPLRLLAKSREIWEGGGLVSKGPFCKPGNCIANVLAVEPVGRREVVTMQTSSRTFIANGFPSHNSTLKSWLALKTVASVQELGGVAVYVDTERTFDAQWAEEIGVDTKEVILKQPKTGEQAVDVMEYLIRSDADLIVWDSIAASLPKAEQEKRAEDPLQPARLAQMMSAACRKLNAANRHSALLCINQTRTNVGVVYGSSESIPGGKALSFYASYRISMRKAGKLTRQIKQWDGEKMVSTKEVWGQKIKVTLEKSKLSTPMREAWFTWDLQKGDYDLVGFLVAHAIEKGHIVEVKKGTWKIEGVSQTVRGRDALLGYVSQRPKIRSRLRELAGQSRPVSDRG